MENENINAEISLEELREILALKGLDIKELAKEAKELKAEKELMISAPEPAKKSGIKSSGPSFELALINYPDFVVRRSTPKTEKLMVFMVSQNAYYIKTIKNGIEEKEVLTRENYASFTSGMNKLQMPEDFWLYVITPGLTAYDSLAELLANESARKAIIGRYFSKRMPDSCGHYLRHEESKMFETIPNLLKSFPDKDLYYNWNAYNVLLKIYGLENVRDFVNEQDMSLVESYIPSFAIYVPWREEGEDIVTIMEKYNCEYKAFKQYVLYDSVRMGMGENLNRFANLWEDTLEMQMDVYGKIKDKYPKHLQEMHDQLAYKQRKMQAEIDKKKFYARTEDSVRFQAQIGDYVFIAPKQPQDFYDEAVAQNNCLAGYVSKYAEGKDYIFFMRYMNAPEASLVTIELDLEGNLVQAYQACNKIITTEQEEVIHKWLNTVVKPAFETAA